MLRAVRDAVWDFFRCLFKIHCIPEKWAYEHLGAIFSGGICPRCGILKQGQFLCNVWTEIVMRNDGVLELHGYDVTLATALGYEIRGNLDDLAEEFAQKRKAKKRNAA